jgi:hypothetical protein
VAVGLGGCSSDDDDGGAGTESGTGTGTGTGTGGDGGTDTGDDGGTGGDSGGTDTGDDGGTSTGGTGTGGTDTGTGGTDTGTATGGTTTGGFGDWNCGPLMQCAGQCADQPCVDACYAQATEPAQGEADDLIECIITNACGHDPVCIENNCGTEYEVCMTGELACDEVVTCMEDCAGDPECETWCYYEGTTEAQDALNALNQCISDNNCQTFGCIQSNCPDELDACYG